MTNHPHQLYATPLTSEADQTRLVGFNCGTEHFAGHVAEWILGSDVFDSIKRGTRVWIFETVAGHVVGYGSLGTTRWKWPLPDGQRTSLVIIPMLGMDSRYFGQPPEPEWRYANQMMAHLIHEATRLVSEWPRGDKKYCRKLVLFVHRDNRRAIRFYERCGFEAISGSIDESGHFKMLYDLDDDE